MASCSLSGSCHPNIIFQSGSDASLTQSNTIFHSGAASFTQPNLNHTHTNAGVSEANLRQCPHGVRNEASEKPCYQGKRACFRVLDWDCDTSKGVSSVDESELKRALSFNPRVDVTSLSETRVLPDHKGELLKQPKFISQSSLAYQKSTNVIKQISGRGGGKGADIIELSDDDGGTGNAVVIELSDNDKSTVQADNIEVSRVDGASQEVTCFATLGSLYQTESRGFYDNTYQYTNSTVLRIKSELHYLEENEDDTFIPLAVLPSSVSKQQQLVLRAVAAWKSIFLTGAAGTGKSFLLGFVIDSLRRHLGQQSVFVAASTGLAACALNGTTIHSFAGIGLGKEKPDLLASKVLGSREAMNWWRNARALVIDEVSVFDGELFDKLDYVAKVVRAELLRDEPLNKSFGGIQLVVTGDFFQIPPVKSVNQQKFFASEADCWVKCFDVQIELKQIFRQHDGNFVGMLNKISRGTHTPETLLLLQKCIRDLPENGSDIKATRLYPLKHDVNQENISTLRMLNREIVEFTALSSSYYRSMLQHMRAGNTLPLCIGAQVMLVKNLDTNSGLVNGARGVVVGFSSLSVLHDKDVDLKAVTAAVSPNGQWPVVQFVCDASQRVIGPHMDSIEDGGREVASRIQVPLILAWGLRVHKCQGVTLDRVKMDLSRAFGFGMVYVVLSRVKNLAWFTLCSHGSKI